MELLVPVVALRLLLCHVLVSRYGAVMGCLLKLLPYEYHVEILSLRVPHIYIYTSKVHAKC